MIFKCPGQDTRNVSAINIKCPGCGYVLEIFSDEIKLRCPQCRGFVWREGFKSCADWCRSARECIGEEKYKLLKGG